MGGGTKGGSSSSATAPNQSVVTQISQPSPQILENYQNAVNRATTVANQPLQQYGGPTVAGFTPMQQSAFNTVDSSQGMANPYINAATQYVGSGATPIQPTQFSQAGVQQYQSPYTQAVVNATQAQFNNQNQQQQQATIGDAISKGAWGGDRAGIAQAELANQQQLAQAPVIAGLNNTAYNQALGEFNQQQTTGVGAQEASGWLGENAGFAMGNLGQEAQSTTLTGASSELQSGALQQQLAQEQLNIPYEQFLQQQAYPFQTASWLSGITEGIGGQSGGVAATTTPGPSSTAQLAGLGLTGLGLLGQSGAFNSPTDTTTARRGGRIERLHRDSGGSTQFDANGKPLPREQHNRVLGEVVGGIGSLWGPVGGMAGTAIGDWFGNVFAGKNGFSGRGDTWSNFDPTDSNGPISGPTGAYSPMGAQGGTGMTSNMFGGMGGMLNANFGGASGGGGPMAMLGGMGGGGMGGGGGGMFGLRRGGRTPYAGGGVTYPYAGGMMYPYDFSYMPAAADLPDLSVSIVGDAPKVPQGKGPPQPTPFIPQNPTTSSSSSGGGGMGGLGGLGSMFGGGGGGGGSGGGMFSNLFGGGSSAAGSTAGDAAGGAFLDAGTSVGGDAAGSAAGDAALAFVKRGGRLRGHYAAGGTGPVATDFTGVLPNSSPGPMFDDSVVGSRGIALPQLKTSGIGHGPNVDTSAPAITTPPPGAFTNHSYNLPAGELTPLSGPLGVAIPQTNDNTALPLLGATLGIGALGLANHTGLFNNNSNDSNLQQAPIDVVDGGLGGGSFDDSTITSNSRGGRTRRDIGGSIMGAGSGMSGAPPNMGNPIASGMMNQYGQLPPEKLQELAVRMPPNSPQGQMIQRALMMSRMKPTATKPLQQQQGAPPTAVAPQAPQAPQAAIAPTVQPQQPGQQPPMRRGGRAGYDDGGDVDQYAQPIGPMQPPRGYKGEMPSNRSFGAMFQPAVDYFSSPMDAPRGPSGQGSIHDDRNPHHNPPALSLPRAAAASAPHETYFDPAQEMASPKNHGASGSWGPPEPPRGAQAATLQQGAGPHSGTAASDEPDVPPQGLTAPPPPSRKPAAPSSNDDDDDVDEGGSSRGRPPVRRVADSTPLPPVQQTTPFKSAYPSRSPWELAIAAGAGMMSSKSPFAGVAAGEGINEGLKYLQKGREDEVGQYKAENEAKRFSEELSNTRARLGIETKHNSDVEQHYQDEDAHWRALEKQGKYQLIPGPGIDPATGSTVMGSYKFNGKTGEREFLPGVVPQAKQGDPDSRRAVIVNAERQRLEAEERLKQQSDPKYKPRTTEDLRKDAETYADKLFPRGARSQTEQPAASPQQPAIDWSKVARPPSVPGNAQYSPSQKSWWWQENGQWKSAPGG